MAFDALRLRNIIQLAGIVRESGSLFSSAPCLMVVLPAPTVFHLALMVFAALQVHQTKTALVMEGDCPGSENYVVREWLYAALPRSSLTLFLDLWWSRLALGQNRATRRHCTLCYCSIMVLNGLVAERTVRRIWVCNRLHHPQRPP